jgi:hypothetical protein
MTAACRKSPNTPTPQSATLFRSATGQVRRWLPGSPTIRFSLHCGHLAAPPRTAAAGQKTDILIELLEENSPFTGLTYSACLCAGRRHEWRDVQGLRRTIPRSGIEFAAQQLYDARLSDGRGCTRAIAPQLSGAGGAALIGDGRTDDVLEPATRERPTHIRLHISP